MKILNLYSGIGGNRKLWDGEKHEITAIDLNKSSPKVTEIYRDHFPHDKVVECDAHEFLRENYKKFDFVWSSPPCPSHSSIRKSGVKSKQYEAVYPDMKLYEEIIFLDHYFEGKWVVENVQSYYEPLIQPQRRHRHYFWSNFTIPSTDIEDNSLHNQGKNRKRKYGFDLTKYDLEADNRGKMLRNCVHPKLGKIIFEASKTSQATISRF